MLENVLVSLHSLKTMGLCHSGASAPLFLRNGELLGHNSPFLENNGEFRQ
jgi:ribosome-associated protein YbcJ (S4-like RNA binding protein)